MSHWTSIEDKLPLKDGVYLVTLCFIKGGKLQHGYGVSTFERGMFSVDHNVGVTHWKDIETPECFLEKPKYIAPLQQAPIVQPVVEPMAQVIIAKAEPEPIINTIEQIETPAPVEVPEVPESSPCIDESILDESIDGLSINTMSCLIGERIFTLRDLCHKLENDLLRIPNLGRVALYEIKRMLEEKGLKLGMDI